MAASVSACQLGDRAKHRFQNQSVQDGVRTAFSCASRNGDERYERHRPRRLCGAVGISADVLPRPSDARPGGPTGPEGRAPRRLGSRGRRIELPICYSAALGRAVRRLSRRMSSGLGSSTGKSVRNPLTYLPELDLGRSESRWRLLIRAASAGSPWDECFRGLAAIGYEGARWRIDIAFTRAKVAVFIDGCFWYGCATHGVRPGADSDWWTAKLTANQARDADTTEYLASIGWQVLRFWEHEEPRTVVSVVQEALGTGERQHDLPRRDPRSVADTEGTTGAGHVQSR